MPDLPAAVATTLEVLGTSRVSVSFCSPFFPFSPLQATTALRARRNTILTHPEPLTRPFVPRCVLGAPAKKTNSREGIGGRPILLCSSGGGGGDATVNHVARTCPTSCRYGKEVATFFPLAAWSIPQRRRRRRCSQRSWEVLVASGRYSATLILSCRSKRCGTAEAQQP